MLKSSSLEHLQREKNLLAFSAGGDSTALFFILLQNKIQFDIAIVNYNLRQQSKDEVKYAQDLASTYKLKCHIYNAEKIEKNFEAKAREIRYDFFEELVEKHTYKNILTAHHLGDRLEWMLMQFCKGAGCAELTGMKELQKRDNYFLVRPLLHIDKQELLLFLHKKNIHYFEDETNLDESIQRNSFRHNFTNPLLSQYLDGIKKSFEYLDDDVESLIEDIKIEKIKDFAYFKNSKNSRSNIFAIDKYLKSELHIITAKERELLKSQKSLIVGRKFLITQHEKYIFISPYSHQKNPLNKEFKEMCRTLHIEPKLRSYLAENEEVYKILKKLLTTI